MEESIDGGGPMQEIEELTFGGSEDRAWRLVVWLVGLAALSEVGFGVALLMLADFSKREDVLLLVGVGMVYVTLTLVMLALGAFVRVWALRLKASINALRDEVRSGAGR